MNDRILQLAKRAGFIFWEDEPWKPHGAIIDWAAQYDKEMETFSNLMVQRFLDLISDQIISLGYLEDDAGKEAMYDFKEVVKEYFGVKQ